MRWLAFTRHRKAALSRRCSIPAVTFASTVSSLIASSLRDWPAGPTSRVGVRMLADHPSRGLASLALGAVGVVHFHARNGGRRPWRGQLWSVRARGEVPPAVRTSCRGATVIRRMHPRGLGLVLAGLSCTVIAAGLPMVPRILPRISAVAMYRATVFRPTTASRADLSRALPRLPAGVHLTYVNHLLLPHGFLERDPRRRRRTPFTSRSLRPWDGPA